MEKINKWSDNRKFYTLFSIMIVSIGIFALWNYNKESRKNSDKTILNKTAKATFFYDLESHKDLDNTKIIMKGEAFSGEFSSLLNDTLEYGVTFIKKVNQVENFDKISTIGFSFRWKASEPLQDVIAVLSIQDVNSNEKLWVGNPVKDGSEDWNLSENAYTIDPAKFDGTDIIRIYVWNKGKRKLLIDDMTIELN